MNGAIPSTLTIDQCHFCLDLYKQTDLGTLLLEHIFFFFGTWQFSGWRADLDAKMNVQNSAYYCLGLYAARFSGRISFR